MKDGYLTTVYPLGKDGKTRRCPYQTEVRDRFKYNVIAEENREQVADFLDLDNIIKRLSTRDHVELQFRRRKFDVYARQNRGEDYEWCSIAITVTERENGVFSAFVISIRNIDEVIRREEEQKKMLSLALARAEAASHAKSDFLSRMSHDIRTPMNAILGMTSIAMMHIDEKKRVMDSLEKITISGRHLLNLINDILDMGKIESGKLQLAHEKFKLADTIENMLSVFHSQLEARQLRLNVRMENIEHENVIGDEHHLQQIFMNIMGNAVKFTPPGGSISISIREVSSNINGMALYEFVFDPFSRDASSDNRRIEGTGLGMSIAVSMARMMNGDIEVESELGKGSTFRVTVHLKLDKAPPANLDFLKGKRALVVDDDQLSCESTCEILRDLNVEAQYVLDGESAIKMVKNGMIEGRSFSIIILDWKMPGKNGLDTAKEIRNIARDDAIIIILSSYDWSAIEEEATHAGINGFISKPVFKSRMIRALANAFGANEGHAVGADLENLKRQDFSGKKILLVEDNEFNTDIAREFLRTTGIEVETAVDGRQALEKVKANPPDYYDLIFMDIQMPVMNGYDAARGIRGLPASLYKTVPIIALTADAFSEDIKKAHDAGMNDHIAKPISLDRLTEVLRKWIHA